MDNDVEPDDAWPAWATEAVMLASPHVEYPAHARSYSAELADLLAGRALDGVEHVGSTAVAGPVAKPVVDLTVMVADPPTWCVELAAEYAELERAAAAAHHDDREAYTAAKAPYVARVLAASATATG